MKKQYIGIKTSLILLAFIAVGTPAAANDAEKIAAIHTIGIISAIGEEAGLQNVGMMVFGNSYETLAIDDWGLDDTMIQNATALLAGRAEIKPVPYDRVAFSTETKPFLGPPLIPVEDLVAGLKDREGIDAYLVITRAELEDPILGTNQLVGGIGLYRHPYGFHHMVADHAFYNVSLIDARTNEIIKSVGAQTGGGGIFDPRFPFIDCDEAIWPESAAAMTDAQKQAMKQTTLGLLNASLQWSLYKVGLLTTEPAERASVACAAP